MIRTMSQEQFVQLVDQHDRSEKRTVKVAFATALTETGRLSTKYATVQVPGNSIRTVADACVRLHRTVSASVRKPNLDAGATVQLILKPEMPGRILAVLIAVRAGLDAETVLGITSEEVETVLAGQTPTVSIAPHPTAEPVKAKRAKRAKQASEPVDQATAVAS